MMELEVSDVQYSRFNDAKALIRLDSIARGFEFKATSTAGKPLPFKGGEPCRVIVDGTAVITGFIEVVQVDYEGASHSIKISGRSKTGDLVDSTLEPFEINTPISLKKIIEQVIAQIGLGISVVDSSGGISDFNEAEDKVGPSVGDNAFEFIETLARKRQVLLTTNGDGNIVITRAQPTLIDVNLQNIIQSNENNILAGSVSYDHTDRFRDYVVKSQLNTSTLDFGSSVADLSAAVDQGGSSTDKDAREGRRLVIRAEKASSNEQCGKRAVWEADIHRTRSSQYSATVRGFRTSKGELWSVNKLILINDEFADINTSMLINSIEFGFSLDTGSRTTLGFVPKDSYTVSISEPEPIDQVGPGLFL